VFLNFIYLFIYCFNILILKIKFLKIKRYYFNIFLKKNLKKKTIFIILEIISSNVPYQQQCWTLGPKNIEWSIFLIETINGFLLSTVTIWAGSRVIPKLHRESWLWSLNYTTCTPTILPEIQLSCLFTLVYFQKPETDPPYKFKSIPFQSL